MRYSFFKLPLIMISFYVICSIILGIISSFLLSDNVGNYSLMSLLIDQIFAVLIYGIAELIFLFICAAIILYRYRIYTITERNIGFILLFAFFIALLVQGTFLSIWLIIRELNYNAIILYTFFYRAIATLIVNFIAGIVMYGLIATSQHAFDLVSESWSFNNKESQKIHHIVYITLLVFYYLLIAIPCLLYFSPSFFYDYMASCLLAGSVVLVFILLLVKTRHSFYNKFTTLQVKKLIYNSLLSLIITLPINLILGCLLLFLLFIIAFTSTRSEITISVLFIAGVALQTFITSFVIKFVTRRYFSATDYRLDN